MISSFSPKLHIFGHLWKTLILLSIVLYFSFVYLSSEYPYYQTSDVIFTPYHKWKTDPTSSISPRTNLSHLGFGLVGSEKGWHHRRHYIESWWQPNVTRGFLFLDRAPGRDLLPWSPSSPPYKVSDDLTKVLNKTDVTAKRIINGIMEAFRELEASGDRDLRWLVMGDDDSIFFLDNMVDILAEYDHNEYYYFGGHSEFVLSNYWYSFSQGFGGAGFILSYPLAKVLAEDMGNCLMRYRHLKAADLTTMSCVADFGVELTALKGIHQIDLRGDISGFLSAHPKFPLLSLHHFDMVSPIFPSKTRQASAFHLMKAANADQSRMLQQTICYHRPTSWSFSISWGYSAHIYERLIPRSYLQYPIETFKTWARSPRPPHYMFNTRLPSSDPCEAPHVFFYETLDKTSDNQILTNFVRAWPRGLPTCASAGNHSADFVSRIRVYSSATKRFQIDRSECCEVVTIDGDRADVVFRECTPNEIIA